MGTLPAPYRQYTLGKLPSHSLLRDLHENYRGMAQSTLVQLLVGLGYLTEKPYRPTAQAVQDKVVVSCEGKALWSVNRIGNTLRKNGINVKRAYANQHLKEYEGEKFFNATDIGFHFNVSGKKINEWLDELGLRNRQGLPTKEAQKSGVGQVREVMYNKKQKKTKKSAYWELSRIARILMDAGHPLDFDYSASLKGKGKNSNVEVSAGSALDERAQVFLDEFLPRFNEHDITVKTLVWNTPAPVLSRAERIMGQEPGFFRGNVYEKFLFVKETVDYSRDNYTDSAVTRYR